MVAILDAILDFLPLECKEKGTLIFSKVMTYSFKIKWVFAFTKKVHEITNEPSLYVLNISVFSVLM